MICSNISACENCSDCGFCAYSCCINNNVIVARKSTTTTLTLELANSQSWLVNSEGTVAIVQNTWLTVVSSYRASTREYWLTVNGVTSSAGIVSQALADRTLSYTWMGRSHCEGADAYFNGDLAGVFVVDEYLSTDTASAIADAMARGEDLTTQGPCAPQVLSPCSP
jgi:hypothetical protein